ncbi:MAG TPA: hypothetical protein VET85_11450 [Stellaceae bacterium]|nr:hypothetical protein [Stellaceae bacterium]
MTAEAARRQAKIKLGAVKPGDGDAPQARIATRRLPGLGAAPSPDLGDRRLNRSERWAPDVEISKRFCRDF